MYFPYFVSYMAAGLIISILVFLWALKSGQFKDQQRARFLPLYGEVEEEPARKSKSGRLGAYVLLFIVGSGLLASAVFVLFVIIKSSMVKG
jgi:cbb3-type cytochrome oxidase maturation protein